MDEPSLLPDDPKPASSAYRVLARKYRPQDFSGLVGQEAMVRTLANAFASGRIAHAFMLTGVRGVGKTTTARIVARALNCIGPDGMRTRPTVDPCGVCAPCVAIAESRDVDVFEMDAASRTGIDDVREIIEGARYLPQAARYKVYIVDEVHMLSKAAFNGLLKTLEEPPPHVKFVFATTEIRKVPVTVLSRCQRFDLKRLSSSALAGLLGDVAAKEGVEAAPDALVAIARAAEGSARDGLSILDQAIAMAEGGRIEADAVRAMLGLADRARVLDLMDAVMCGDAVAALAELRAQYDGGADPVAVLQDMLELTHWLTRLKVAPEAAKDAGASEAETVSGRAMAAKLSMATLTRAWTLLLKGLAETRDAPLAIQAAEMALMRLAFAAEIPPIGALLERIDAGDGVPPKPPAPRGPTPGPQRGDGATAVARDAAPPRPAPARETAPQASAFPDLDSVLKRLEAEGELIFKDKIERYVRLVAFAEGRVALSVTSPPAAREIVQGLADRLKRWTGKAWFVELREGGGPTVLERRAEAKAAQLERYGAHPLVRKALEIFPGARIAGVREAEAGGEVPADEGDRAPETEYDA